MTAKMTPRRASYEDLLAVPDRQVAELLAGALYTSPRPSPRHALASSRLLGEVEGRFGRGNGEPGGWWIVFEPEVHLGDDVLVPDLAGWRRERMPRYPDAAFFELAPDWVCEIVSPRTRRADRVIKMPIYARESIGHVWLIDPDTRTLEVFTLQERDWLLAGQFTDDDEVGAPPFEGHFWRLDLLWPES